MSEILIMWRTVFLSEARAAGRLRFWTPIFPLRDSQPLLCVFPAGLMRGHGEEETSLPARVYRSAKGFSGAPFLLKYHLLLAVV